MTGTVIAIASTNLDNEPWSAPTTALIGQLHRYSPYDRLPISTNGRHPNRVRTEPAHGCTTTATNAADARVTSGSSHR